MKIITYAFGIAVVTAAVFAATSKTAGATADTCKIEAVIPVTVQDPGKNFTVNSDKTVTAKFKVTGPANCKKQAVFAVWNSPTANGLPLETQTLHDYAPKTTTSFGPGVHTITAKLPTCTYWQLDLLEGSDPRGINGTANYGNLMHPVSNTNKPGYRRNIIDAQMGGNKCNPEPPKDACPNIAEMQKEVPAGYTRDANGNCVPTPQGGPDEPVAQVAAVQTPAELPKTGAGAVATTFVGVTTAAGLAHAIIRRLRNAFLR